MSERSERINVTECAAERSEANAHPSPPKAVAPMSDDGNGSERWLRALNAALATAWPFGNLAWLFGRRPRATTQDNS